MLMYFMTMMSIMFIFTKHPLSSGMILLIQTTLTSFMTGMMNYNYWYSYILFLIMIGGLMILFIYMTSIASNEKFKMNPKISFILLFLTLPIFLSNFYFNYSFNMTETLNQNILLNEMSMMKYLNFPNNLITLIIIIYLLITLIAIVKITKTNHGPMRQTI